MNGIAISPDRTLIATAHSDGRVRLWRSGLDPVSLQSINSLPFGSAISMTLRAHGLYYFKVQPQSGRNMVISLEPSTGGASLRSLRPSNSRSHSSDAKFANLGTED